MAFDRQLAEKLIRPHDRDIARFFAGRKEAIKTFDDALMLASDHDAAIFRIFQGPPGCGKTSLANHLAGRYAGRALFVPCAPSDLSDLATLSDRIQRAAINRGGRIAKAARATAESVGERLGARPLADAATSALAGFSAKGATVVLHLDEAHGRVNAGYPGLDETLLDLHTVGMGVPGVLLLTGLGHTHEAVTSVKGLSRLPPGATHDIGTLPKMDCVRSTKMMLAALDATEPTYARDRVANLTGELAHEWPAHLNGAQVALCEELVRGDGIPRDVDASTVRERSDAKRRDYYEARAFGHPILKVNRALTLRILAEVHRAPPREVSDLSVLCAEHIDRAGMTSEFRLRGLSSADLADTMLEKGLLTNVRSVRDRVNVAIPSMADWAEEELPEIGGRTPPARTISPVLAR